MPVSSASLFDELYGHRDHRAEISRALGLVGRPIRRALDVGCATGEHARALVRAGVGEVEGIDVDAALLARARRKRIRGARFRRADMTKADLGERFDAIFALYGVVAYARTREKLAAFCANVARHLDDGGVAVIEPWCMSDDYAPRIGARTVDLPDVKIARASAERFRGSTVEIDVRYVVARAGAGRLVTIAEKLVMGLFSREDHLRALRSAGLRPRYVRGGIARDDGVFVAVKPSAPTT